MDIIAEIAFRIIALMIDIIYTTLRFFGFRIAVLGSGFFLLHMLSYHPIFIIIFIVVVIALYAPVIY
ncbi:hypothetical protein, partial [Proteus columbae]|uniref:hypothetical protein n=2 Tax=Gammaproteobacteria TaxID=1236 RepID=UPI00200B73D3